jgi:hypothetical protein
MNTVERDQNIYPIGYMITGESTAEGPIVNIVDMRDLEVICRTELTGAGVYGICTKLNENLRDGQYEENYDSLKEDADCMVNGRVVGEQPAEPEQPVLATNPAAPTLPVFPTL